MSDEGTLHSPCVTITRKGRFSWHWDLKWQIAYPPEPPVTTDSSRRRRALRVKSGWNGGWVTTRRQAERQAEKAWKKAQLAAGPEQKFEYSL